MTERITTLWMFLCDVMGGLEGPASYARRGMMHHSRVASSGLGHAAFC